MTSKATYRQQLQAKLDEWQSEIDKLRSEAEEAEAEPDVEHNQRNRQIEGLQEKQDDAKQKLAELEEAGEGAWEHLKSGIDKAWNDLGEAVSAARSKFR